MNYTSGKRDRYLELRANERWREEHKKKKRKKFNQKPLPKCRICKKPVQRSSSKKTKRHRICPTCKKLHENYTGFNPYILRDRLLKGLGYKSYKEYLQSDKWKKIKSRVLARDKYTCQLCFNYGSIPHHKKYDKATMTGYQIHNIVTLCKPCHLYIEMENGKKLLFEESAKLFEPANPNNVMSEKQALYELKKILG